MMLLPSLVMGYAGVRSVAFCTGLLHPALPATAISPCHLGGVTVKMVDSAVDRLYVIVEGRCL